MLSLSRLTFMLSRESVNYHETNRHQLHSSPETLKISGFHYLDTVNRDDGAAQRHQHSRSQRKPYLAKVSCLSTT